MSTYPRPAPDGRSPDNRRQAGVKLLWISVWMFYMSAPVDDLLDGDHSTAASVLGWAGLAVFVGAYLALVVRPTRGIPPPRVYALLASAGVLCLVLPYFLGPDWLVLFVYTAIACGAALPAALARWAVPIATALLIGMGEVTHAVDHLVPSLVVPCLLGGFAMIGIRHLLVTTRELREARATVAHLAANEERLRLARDLHDLLGHSLSLITLKSELAGRMLPARPDDAARQVADIERVSRQALVDVREAVSGYRMPTLPVEIAGARTALTAAGIEADLPGETAPDGARPPADAEGALAWALREAVTNVVRHSAAARCTVALTERNTLDGPVLELSVEDDGNGPGAAVRGNGLAGIAERLESVGGALRTGPGQRRGFSLLARVPLGATGRDAA
ncbi:sensor histidine kinase [Streptomyces sp. NPDC051776]|uniref:sensor histidine kinase n=1 Tax=Streptomyces sp. NPDC051776 TaxID=3155414 RepID=UPI003422F10E